MAAPNQGDLYDAYFRRADLDGDGKISGAEAVTFFQGANLSKQVLAQIWNYADQSRTGSLGRAEFYNALKLVTVAQRKRELIPDIVKAALFGQASAKIPAPQINLASLPQPQSSASGTTPSPSQMANFGSTASQNPGFRPVLSNSTINQQYNPPPGSGLVRPPNPISGIVTSPVQGVGFQGNGPSPNHAGLPSGAAVPRPQPVASGFQPTSIMQPRPPATQNGFASGSHLGGNTFSAASSTQVGALPSVAIPAGGVSAGGPHSTLQPQTVSPPTSTGHQPQVQWPRATPTDIQKYIKVFKEVDTDKDGQITGDQARNLFLSWRLPREVLKQVWNLSDQDNDSMLSVREFCIALYLMERYREGRPLPAVLPSTVMLDFPASAQPASGHGHSSRGYSAGFQQPQAPGAGQRPSARPPGKPPLPIPASLSDDRLPPKPQKAKVPVLEKHLVDQLSEEEQKSLNLKFQEALEANKKVEDLEKEIKESREKMEFYRVKMQELVLYKSRCDNRLNEVIEKASLDKLEVESLAKKYEEKYLRAGNVASKLTIEEATFRDIQERKMEMYQAVVKMEQEGSNETLQVRADNIQSNLEELVRTLSERCKKYGLRSKPTTLVELPFGWQPGIQEAAADWDEDWDKFEDEGFTFVKEMTLDVQNVIAPPKPKVKVCKREKALAAESETAVHASDAESIPDKPSTENAPNVENGVFSYKKEDNVVRSPMASPSAKSSNGSPHDRSKENHFEKIVDSSTSPRSQVSQSNNGVVDTSASGVKKVDEPTWGTFDASDDADSVLGSSKAVGRGRHIDDLFGHGEFTLPPIKTSSSQTEDFLPKTSVYDDSVPSTPADAFLPPKISIFADSVPSTPADSFLPKRSSIFADSVPGTPAEGILPKHSIFADSVPSTPVYNEGGGQEKNNYSFQSFDSFRSTNSGFQPHERLSRFDSMRSTTEFDSEEGESFQQKGAFARFDSIRSNNDLDFSQQLSSFDDTDPFGSGSGAFKSSFASETPRRDSNAFASSAFRSSFGSETPRSEVDPFGSVGPFGSSFASETPKADTDFYNSSGPFRSSFGIETPRADTDHFGAVGPFGSSFSSETPRTETNYFANSGSFKLSFGNETPRSEFDSFGFGGPFSSSFSSETPRRDSDGFGSSDPFKSTTGNEKTKGGNDSWSAF